jgi:T5SS/PEP-CTERM-associated repeat protein
MSFDLETRSPARGLLRAELGICALFLLLVPESRPADAAITVDPNNVGANSVYPAYDGTDPWQPSGGIYVGGTADAEVRVDGGSDVIAGATSFGIDHPGFATITVQGSGSSWTDTSTGSPSMDMGGYGNVNFNVLSGGALATTGAWFRSEKDYFYPRTGHVATTISGAGSIWNARAGDVWLSADPDDATVAIHILDGGQFVGARNFVIGYGYMAGPALCEVRGAGSKISVTSILSVAISRDQGLRISEGGVVESFQSFVGQLGDDVALAIVDGAGSRWTNSNDIWIGRDGDGAVQVVNGATLASRRGTLGLRTSSYSFTEPSAGSARVEGSNSTWTVNQTLTVASNDHGELIVRSGGKVTANALDVASSTTSYATGSVGIDGEGSLVQVAGAFRAGVNNQADIGISGGGDLISGTGLVNRSFFDVSGAGSTWSGGGKTVNPIGTLQVRNGGQIITSAGSQLTNLGVVRGDGTLAGTFRNQGIVRPGLSVGTLTLSGNYEQTSTGTFDVELGSAGNDLLNISGTAVLSGTLHVAMFPEGTNTLVPHAHDRFDILTATGGVSGIFGTTSLPPLGSNLYWSIQYGPNVVSLEVVPEPATCVLAVVAGTLVAIRRRER